MAYTTVEVDVDLSEIDFDDLLEEFLERSNKFFLSKNKNKNKNSNLEKLFDILNELYLDKPSFKLKTLDDKLKYEHILKIFDKYSVSDFEKLLPE